MAFNLRDLKVSKKESEEHSKKRFFKHLVFGDDFFSAMKFISLVKEFGSENCAFILPKKKSKEEFLNLIKVAPRLFRNEEAVSLLQDKFQNLDFHKNEEAIKFYKDTKFYEFGGRAKPYELKEEEKYFLNPSYDCNLESLIKDVDWEILKNDENIFNKFIKGIELVEAQDLVEPSHFLFRTGEDEGIFCENLYFFYSKERFLKLIKNEEKFEEDYFRYLSNETEIKSLGISFSLHKKIELDFKTLFLPQSMSEERGHIIFEFYGSEIRALVSLNEDELSTDEMGKKVKLIKRTLERVIPEFKNNVKDEKLIFFDDLLKKKNTDLEVLSYPHLYFLGTSYDDKNLKALSSFERALLSV